MLTVDSPSPTDVLEPPAESHVEERGGRRRLSVGESIFRGALANFSSQPLTWGCSLLAATMVPRFLGSDGVGQLAIAFSITGLAGAALDLGIVDYLTRRIAQKPGQVQRDLGIALLIQIVTFCLGALAIVALAPHLAPSLGDFRILYWAVLWMVVGCTQSLLTASLRGQERHMLFAWLNAMPAVISTLGTVAILFAGADVLAYTAWGIVLGIVAIVFNWKVAGVRPIRPNLDLTFLRNAREFVQGGLPFVSWNLTMAFYGGIDRLLLGLFVSSSEVGWYAAAYRIVGIPVFIPTLLITPLFPALSRTQDSVTLRRAIAQTLRMALLCTIPLSAGIYVVAPVVPSLFGWPADFANAVPLMMILSLQVPIVAVDMVLGTVIMAIGRERAWVRVGLVAGALNLACNLLAIPFFEHATGIGPIGASIVTVITEIWMFIGAAILLPKDLLEVRVVWPIVRNVVAGIGAGLVALALMPVALVLAAAGGALSYAVLVLLLRVVSREDIAYISNRVRPRAR